MKRKVKCYRRPECPQSCLSVSVFFVIPLLEVHSLGLRIPSLNQQPFVDFCFDPLRALFQKKTHKGSKQTPLGWILDGVSGSAS